MDDCSVTTFPKIEEELLGLQYDTGKNKIDRIHQPFHSERIEIHTARVEKMDVFSCQSR